MNKSKIEWCDYKINPMKGLRPIMNIWAAQWRSKNKLDGVSKHLIYKDGQPVLFRTRRECRRFIDKYYSYIAERPDLQEEPCGWQMPIPVKVRIEVI